jgi:hypothetical protein
MFDGSYINNNMVQGLSLQAAQMVKIFTDFMQPAVFLSFSQNSAIYPYPECLNPVLTLQFAYLRPIFIFCYSLSLYIPSGSIS